MSSKSNLSPDIRNLPYDHLKNFYENPKNISRVSSACRSMIRRFLPKGHEEGLTQNDLTDEAIRAIACSAIEKLEGIEQMAVLLMTVPIDCTISSEEDFRIASTPLSKDQRMAVAKELPLSLLLEAMQEFSSQKKALEGWEKGYKNRVKASQRIVASLATFSSDSHGLFCNKLDLSGLELHLPPPFISELPFGRMKKLSLPGNGLEEFPNLGVCKNLKKLDLSDNKISTIPIGVTDLRCLRKLFLSSNQILEIPKDLKAFPCLEMLDLWNNKISAIRQRVFFPISLKELNLSKNQIITFPKKLEGLSNIKSLDLSANRISTIPDEVEGLISVRHLNIADNFAKNKSISLIGYTEMS